MKICKVVSLVIAGLIGAGAAHFLGNTPESNGNPHYIEKKLALLEQENARLRAMVVTHQQQSASQEDAAIRAEIEQAVEEVRGLDFQQRVSYHTLQRDEFPAVVLKMIEQQYSDAEITQLTDGYVALGLVPQGFDMKQVYVDLLAEQVAAFYDPHTNRLVTFANTPLADMQNRIILAHELTHAMQDQHFSLKSLPLEDKGNDDRALASSALIEGDATILMTHYMVDNLSGGGMSGLFTALWAQDMDALNEVPDILRESLLFPYTKGEQFCSALYAQGGFDAINRAYANPPSATSLILHPERYLTDPHWQPQEITWEEPLPEGCEVVTTNVLGEFGLAVWLGEGGGSSDVIGWQGDSYRVVRHSSGELGYTLKSVWNDAASAHRFHHATVAYLSLRYGKEATANTDPAATATVTEFTANGRSIRVESSPNHRVRVTDMPQ